jgi:predicted Zn finger-like uncharacterized protein
VIASCPRCRARYRIARETIGPLGSRLRCSKCTCVFRVQAPPAAPEKPASSEGARGRALVVESDRTLAQEIAALISDFGLTPEVVNDGEKGLLGIFRLPPDVAILGADLPGLSAPAIAEIVRRAPHLKGQPLIRVSSPGEPVGASEFEATYTLQAAEVPAGLAALLSRLGFEGPAAAPAPPPEARAAPAGEGRPEVEERPAELLLETPEGSPAPAGRPGRAPADASAPPESREAAPGLARESARRSSGAAAARRSQGEEPAPVQAGPPPGRPETRKFPRREVAPKPRGSDAARPPAPAKRPAAATTRSASLKSAPADRPAPAGEAEQVAPEVAAAQRLARIIVADIILYNEEKFARAVEAGNLQEALRAELQEGMALFKQRIPAEVRAKCDFVREELERRAARVRGVA